MGGGRNQSIYQAPVHLAEYSICPTFVGQGTCSVQPAGLAGSCLSLRPAHAAPRYTPRVMGRPLSKGKQENSPSEAILCSLPADAAWTERASGGTRLSWRRDDDILTAHSCACRRACPTTAGKGKVPPAPCHQSPGRGASISDQDGRVGRPGRVSQASGQSFVSPSGQYTVGLDCGRVGSRCRISCDLLAAARSAPNQTGSSWPACSVWVLGVGVGVLPAHPDPVLSCPVLSYSYPESFTRAYFLN